MKIYLSPGPRNAIRWLLQSVVLSALATTATIATAGPIIDTTQWTTDVSPSNGEESTQDGWTRLAENTPTRPSNASGSLISDFTLVGDFLFSGIFSPIFDARSTSTCGNLTTPICNDNDILGIVFGWQNAANHYRLGFGQGGVNDITGNDGLFLVREQDGDSTTLASWDSSFWVDDATYDFSVRRVANELTVSVEGLVRNTRGAQGADPEDFDETSLDPTTLEKTVSDAVFLNGRIGVYTQSQASVFGEFDVEGEARYPVPLPGSLSLMMLGLLGFSGRGFRRR